MYGIDRFTVETPHGKSLWGEKNCLSFVFFLDQIPKVKYAILLQVNILSLLGGGVG